MVGSSLVHTQTLKAIDCQLKSCATVSHHSKHQLWQAEHPTASESLQLWEAIDNAIDVDVHLA